MFTKDPGGCLSVKVGFSNKDLEKQKYTRSVTNVPMRMPGLNLAESSKSQGREDALDNLDVVLGSSELKICKGDAKGSDAFKSEPAVIGANVKQVVERISHILGNLQVPARSGGSEVKQCQEGLQPSRVNIEEVGRTIMEGLDSRAVDGQTLSG